ncbi:protein BatD [Ancylomarina euxinus]|uniref:Protein BatD n=1 Tax=Ancylomarina euxinus TaxID=2283627 RepID=A0A425XXA8_9BACT|nr:BatD family protein [Ancylomarina euxinus]MCZ4696169.1 BatD family protein [Ancylomarina euxinus]MUP16578.1 protein BatD [Ancylomarina euxinus]RRG19281.1 protein BatD [Ancylomarina euxinus]
MKRLFFLLLTCLFISTSAFADKTKFTATAPNVVALGEQFRLSYSLNEKGEGLKLPVIKGFRVLLGPSTSTNMSTQYINGKMTSSSSYTYTYVLLAETEGKFTFEPAEITVDGKLVKSNSHTIEVVRSSTKNKQQGTHQSTSAQAQNITKDNLYLKVNVDRKSVFMGEPVKASLKIYTKDVKVVNFEQFKEPSYQGFLTQNIEGSNSNAFQGENINGEIFYTYTIKEILLFPQHDGEIIIDPMELSCIVQLTAQARSRGFFDDFFNNYKNVRVPRKSEPVKIKVKPVPNNAPKSFDGAVGQFKMNTTINQDSVKVDDAITMKVTISGNGNMKLINPLKFDFPADFEVYDPKTNQNLQSSAKGMTGSTTFEYLIIPRHAGDFTIPANEFTYFDPNAKRYITKLSPEFKIYVEKGEGGISNTTISSFTKEDVKFIGKDIRFIKTNIFEPIYKGEIFFGTLNFYLAYILPLFIFLMAFVFNRKRIKQNADVAKMKNKRANRVAMKRLKAASISLKANKKEAFYDEILKALWDYISDKFNLPLSDLSKDNINGILVEKEIEKEIITDFMAILDTCEFARYAPSSGSSEMDSLYQKTIDTITKLEKNIK